MRSKHSGAGTNVPPHRLQRRQQVWEADAIGLPGLLSVRGAETQLAGANAHLRVIWGQGTALGSAEHLKLRCAASQH